MRLHKILIAGCLFVALGILLLMFQGENTQKELIGGSMVILSMFLTGISQYLLLKQKQKALSKGEPVIDDPMINANKIVAMLFLTSAGICLGYILYASLEGKILTLSILATIGFFGLGLGQFYIWQKNAQATLKENAIGK